MTNETPNTPNTPMLEPGRPSMFQTWVNAITKPNEATFAEIGRSPNAKATTAFLWVFIAALVQSLLTLPVRGMYLRTMMNQFTGGPTPPNGGIAAGAFAIICGAPIAAVISVVFFAIGVALVQWIARMFGGRGTFDQLAYAFAAIAAPIGIIGGLLGLLGAIPYIGFCFGILAALVFIYQVVLEIMAVKGVHGLGWGQAAGSVLIPVAALLLVVCCLAIGIGALFGAALGNVFRSGGPFPFPIPTP